MKTLGRFLAPSAVFLALPAFGLSVRDCGPLAPRADHYIVRASTGGLSTSSLSLVERRALENPASVIHKTPVVSIESNSQKPTEKSTLTVATELSSGDLSEVLSDSRTLSVEQDCVVHVATLPSDPVPSITPWQQLRLPDAWTSRVDASSVIVSVSDTGIDLTHEDLTANLWTNSAEVNGQAGVDDDGNGCIDDIHGCDFGDYDGDPSPFSGGDGVHGTHVAGIIGAVGNNGLGSSGVAWSVRLMAAKGFDVSGDAYISNLLNTIYYSVNNGARVINCSWGADRTPTQAEKDAFQFALDMGALPVVAAGNSAIDAAGSSPAGLDNVLTVGSINSLDKVSAFSNFGSHVALYAPGGDAGTRNEFIYSTLPGNQYGNLRGTSMATPFVSGLAALTLAVNPKLSAIDVRTILISSARSVSSPLPNGTVATIKIPDASAALVMAATYIPTPYGVSSAPSAPISKPITAPGSDLQTVSTSSSCALKRTGATPDISVIALLLPLMMIFVLRKRPA